MGGERWEERGGRRRGRERGREGERERGREGERERGREDEGVRESFFSAPFLWLSTVAAKYELLKILPEL